MLHTWTQKLRFHPHIHCIVPGGGLSADRRRWVSAREDFFVSVRVLSAVFRGKLLAALEAAAAAGKIAPAPALLRRAACKSWVVYCKRPFAGPQQVLAYLGRYTHRIAIGNERLVAMSGGDVTFSFKDRRDGDLRLTRSDGRFRAFAPPGCSVGSSLVRL